MFASRGLGWKIAGALAVLALLGVLCVRRGERVRPAIWRCVARPELWDGVPVRFGCTVERVEEHGFLGRTPLARVFVRAADLPVEGEAVEVSGIFRAGDSRVEARRIRALPPSPTSRLLLTLVSVLVLAGVILNFLRHFAFRPEPLQAEGTD